MTCASRPGRAAPSGPSRRTESVLEDRGAGNHRRQAHPARIRGRCRPRAAGSPGEPVSGRESGKGNMTMKLAQRSHVEPDAPGVAGIPLQAASFDIWDGKYRLKRRDGAVVDRNVDETWRRIARAIADVEATDELRARWFESFLWALRQGAVPAGRIVSNAGALEHKPATSTINCTVSGTVHDSMDDILEKVHEAGLTLKAGCGIGVRVLHPAPQGRIRHRRRGVHLGAAVVHGHLRPDVLHRVVGRRAQRCADGHLRRGPSRRPRLHPRQARGRAAPPVQPLAAHHPRVHGGGPRRRPVEARVPAHVGGSRARRRRSGRSGVGGVAKLAGGRRLRHERPRQGRVPGVPIRAGPADLGRHHVLDVRLRRTGVHPDRRDQRHEQQLVLRGRPRDQPLRRAAPSAVRLLPARLDQPHPVRARPVHGTARASTGRRSGRPSPSSPGCSTTSWRSTGSLWNPSATRSGASAATGWATSASARCSRCCG